ncbi:hypothetical protein R1sor_003823 [Riccia sorocarpa]|uniref:Uncharacterized protein n=1 Tax=Riccia sorocarpa TaxID=122646 RepID=A0ABD3H4W2_9MARC
MLDLLTTDDENGSSNGDSDCDPDLFEKSDSKEDDEIDDLIILMDVVEQSKYLTKSERWEKSSKFLYKFRRDEWSEDDHSIEIEREDDMGLPSQGAREYNTQRPSVILSVCAFRPDIVYYMLVERLGVFGSHFASASSSESGPHRAAMEEIDLCSLCFDFALVFTVRGRSAAFCLVLGSLGGDVYIIFTRHTQLEA